MRFSSGLRPVASTTPSIPNLHWDFSWISFCCLSHGDPGYGSAFSLVHTISPEVQCSKGRYSCPVPGQTTNTHMALGGSTGHGHQHSPCCGMTMYSHTLDVTQARHHQGTRWQHRPFTSSWSLDINMALGGCTDCTSHCLRWHPRIQHQPVPHQNHISSSISPHSTGSVLPLFLSHLSITYLLIIVIPPLRPLVVFSPACV